MTRFRSIFAASAIGILAVAGLAWAAEPHPEINAAQRDLRMANQHLEHAAQDFGGHRVKAMELIRQAQEELEAALRYDQH